MEFRLDEIDKRILYHLVDDARHTSAPDVAEEVNVTSGTIRNRIDQLEERGVISGYHAHVDYERAEGLLTNIYKCTTSSTDRQKVVRQILQIPGVVNVREIMTGREDLEIKAVGPDTEEFTRIAEAIMSLGVDIEDQDLLRREFFRPYHAYGPTETRKRPSITDFMDLSGKAEVVELTVHGEAPITGRTLRDANEAGLIDEDTLVVAIERDGEVITPRGKTTIEAGDIVTVFIHDGLDEGIESAFAAPVET
jgi:Lrp/AsnC family leucine-responsive transcriptional regulator